MLVLSLALIIVGVFFLVLSVKPACTICKQSGHTGWKVLLGLITLFIASYLFFLGHLITQASLQNNSVEHYLSVILFGGSIFVKMVITLSLKSIESTKKISQQEKYNSLHDSLTDLPNRKLFIEAANERVKHQKPFSLFIIDINRFRQINDMLGHYFADQLLINIADVIKQQLDDTCCLSRIGGDQFTLITNAVSDEEINHLISNIHRSLITPFIISNYNLKIDIACGGTLFPKNSQQVVSLLQQADMAMSSAKEKNCDYVIYNEKIDNDAKSRLEISSKLPSAIENKEFEVYYQPIIKVKEDDICHLEALIRWPLKGGGFIPPDQFIPIAEQSNQIRKITFLVLDNIGEHLLALKKIGVNVCIHINLSARDLQDNQLSEKLATLVEEGFISPHELILEVTETAVMKDLLIAKTVLLSLSEQSFKVSLDDFGTGYSSLSMLLELPISQIKIDRSFVISMQKDKTAYEIVKSIIFMAHSLNCTVVAEGVENRDVINELISLKCNYLQGYFYSKPLPFSSLIEYCIQTKH